MLTQNASNFEVLSVAPRVTRNGTRNGLKFWVPLTTSSSVGSTLDTHTLEHPNRTLNRVSLKEFGLSNQLWTTQLPT